jgi:hypothetical protein
VHFSTDASGNIANGGSRSRDAQQQQQEKKQSSQMLTSEATSAKGEGVWHGRRYSQSSHEVSTAALTKLMFWLTSRVL